MKQSLFSACNLYIALWMLQWLNYALEVYSSSLSVTILVFLFVWSLVCAYKVLIQGNIDKLMKWFTALFVFFSVYGLIRVIGGKYYSLFYTLANNEVGPREYLIAYWQSLLPIFAFYYYTLKGQLTEETIKKWIIVFMAVATVSFFGEQTRRMAALVTANYDGVTNNMGYAFLSIIPALAFLYKKPFLQYVSLAYCMFFIILGMKRGAILIALICLVYFLWKSRMASEKKAGRTFILGVALLVIGVFFVSELLQTNAYFSDRINDTLEGNDSGRSNIYQLMWDYFIHKTSLFQMIFGTGADGTILMIGQAAHNDWLEILVDLGLVGAICYLIYWLNFYKKWRCLIKSHSFYAFPIGLLAIILFMKSLFSMSINDMTVPLTCVFGFCLASSRMEENNV